MQTSSEFGKIGEQLAVNYLKTRGYEIVQRNYRYLKAEVDIIARKEDILAVVEVKSRSSEHLESVAQMVTEKKIKLLVMATDHYVLKNDLEVEVRFDIITILKRGSTYKIEHLENAFYHF